MSKKIYDEGYLGVIIIICGERRDGGCGKGYFCANVVAGSVVFDNFVSGIFLLGVTWGGNNNDK